MASSYSLDATIKIIYPGGHVEFHDKPVPAADIMSQNPKCWVTRPDVFQQPWAAVVKPETVLPLGHKFYVVPISTVRKLRRQSLRSSSASGLLHDGATTTSSSAVTSSTDPSPAVRRKDGGGRGRAKGSCMLSLRRSLRCLLSADKESDKMHQRNGRRSAGGVRTREGHRARKGEGDHGKGKSRRSRESSRRNMPSPKRDPGTPSYNWQPSLDSITEE